MPLRIRGRPQAATPGNALAHPLQAAGRRFEPGWLHSLDAWPIGLCERAEESGRISPTWNGERPASHIDGRGRLGTIAYSIRRREG
jgi:hypothetical protein